MKYKLFDSEKEMLSVLEENKPRLAIAGGHGIALVLRHGKLTAFIDLCPHMGASLHEGKVNRQGEIVCPLHAYKFDLKTGDEENQRCSSLKMIPVEKTPEGIYLSL